MTTRKIENLGASKMAFPRGAWERLRTQPKRFGIESDTQSRPSPDLDKTSQEPVHLPTIVITPFQVSAGGQPWYSWQRLARTFEGPSPGLIRLISSKRASARSQSRAW